MLASLMMSRRFAPVFWCQFFSAFNDNFIKNALVILILYRIAVSHGSALVTLAGAVLVVPIFFLSALGGELADKYDKAIVAERLKLAELPIALLAAVGFVMSGSSDPDVVWWSVPVLFVALFLFGAMASLFGPIKYGILPDHLEVKELPTANALMEGATFLAILGGTIAGGLALGDQTVSGSVPAWTIAVVMMVFAALGWWSATQIKPTGAGQPDLKITKNPLVSTVRLVGELRSKPRLWIGGLVVSWFWLAGIVTLALLPSLVKTHIGGSESIVTLGLVVFTLGIALGSTIAALASHGRPNLALVPLGALLMGLFSLDVAWVLSTMPKPTAGTIGLSVRDLISTPSGTRLAIDLGALAASGGLFIVPAFAAVQSWAPADHRARVIAAVNILNAALMTFGTLSVTGFQLLGGGVPVLFMALGVGNVTVAGLVAVVWGIRGQRAEEIPHGAH